MGRNNMKMSHKTLIGAGLALVLTTAAFAQTPPTRIRGQIEKVDGNMLVIKARDGAMLNVKLADDARITAMVKSSVADIRRAPATRGWRRRDLSRICCA